MAKNINFFPSFTAKDAEKKLNDDFKTCKAAFIACSKLEDAALEYMIKCYTSVATIKANLVELLKIKDSCEKLKTNQEAIVSTSQSSGRRVKRQKNSESVTCATYIVQVSVLNVVSTNIFIEFLVFMYYKPYNIQVLQSTSLTGKGTTIVTQSTTIIKESVQTCSSEEIVSIQQNIVILTAVISKVSALIVQYQAVSKVFCKNSLT